MPAGQRYQNVDQFVSAFQEQVGGMPREAQQAAMDTYNGAISDGRTTDEAIRLATMTARRFAGGQQSGETPAVQAGPQGPAGGGVAGATQRT